MYQVCCHDWIRSLAVGSGICADGVMMEVALCMSSAVRCWARSDMEIPRVAMMMIISRSLRDLISVMTRKPAAKAR